MSAVRKFSLFFDLRARSKLTTGNKHIEFGPGIDQNIPT
jgi:hypothetical protein